MTEKIPAHSGGPEASIAICMIGGYQAWVKWFIDFRPMPVVMRTPVREAEEIDLEVTSASSALQGKSK